MSGKRLAIIGGGIAGLGCAHFLNTEFDLTLFEKGDYPGGHVNTVDLEEGIGKVSFDTGFMVYNRVTYPEFCRLLDMLSVRVKPTDMSFSVNYRPLNLEWSGTGFSRFFARRLNFFNLDFWRLLFSIDRFNKEARKLMDDSSSGHSNDSVEEFVEKKGLGDDLLNLYILPMMSALWSAPPGAMLKFPVLLLIRFMYTHGLLSVYDKLDWFTIEGGARNYVQKLVAPFEERIILSKSVASIRRAGEGVEVTCSDGESQTFDRCILACHADQAKALLDPGDFPREHKLLEPFKYQRNVATVHGDSAVMPDCRGNWASWNYRIKEDDKTGDFVSTTHYWMNSLQGISRERDYFVTIDSAESVNPELVFKQIEYEHPVFDLDTFKAQAELENYQRANKQGPVHLCGSYFKFGFHEDAFASSVNLSRSILGRSPWN